ncbi:RNA methyltransferase [Puniceicoccaceae bacterium K14]|nr:RNA methyltransferase [Puniceicoccaceae bacterium K14]
MAERLSKAKLSYFRKFKQKKMRDEHDAYLIEGWHLLEAALLSGAVPEFLVYDDSKVLGFRQLEEIEKAAVSGTTVFLASREEMVQISETQAPQGVFALVRRKRFDWDEFCLNWTDQETVRLVALDEVADPGNCGSILRSADWFGLDGAIVGKGGCELENAKVVRSTMGAIFNMPILGNVDLGEALSQLSSRGFSIITAELGGAVSLHEFEWPQKCVVVIGNEARGVSKAVASLSNQPLMIPKFGKSESLNAAMAASIIMSHWRLES